MRKLYLGGVILIVFATLLGARVEAQVNAQVTVNWVNPTTTVPPASLPLTGIQALTEHQIIFSDTPIPPDYAGEPTLVVTPVPLTRVYTMSIANGGTIHVRMRSCHRPTGVLECSVWTSELTQLVDVPTTPNMPTSVTITINIT